jgi:cytochrome c oxidase accessory protein FixG
VLLDQNSVVIAYDDLRGEPRGKIKKGTERELGDCIDCNECVVVCPTGIDIRNGTQLECVNCTACIDACDNIMDRVEKPRGLIRFASSNMIKNKSKFKVTARVIGYSVVLVVLITILTLLISSRKPIDVTILRAPGMLFQEQPGGLISNLYSIKLVNKTFDEANITMKLDDMDGEIKLIGNELKIEGNGVGDARFLVLLQKDKIKKMNTPIKIEVISNGKAIGEFNTTFLGQTVN